MARLSGRQFRRTSALLCVALMLVFALGQTAGILNELEHGQGPVLPHSHLAFSGLVQDHDHHAVEAEHGDDDHAGLHHDAEHDNRAKVQDDHDGAGQLAGHHHHGDVSSSLIMLASDAVGLTARQTRKGDFRSDRLRVSMRQALPERPPRTSQIAA